MEAQAQANAGQDKSLLSGISTGISDFFTQSISLKGGVPANMQMQNELQFNAMMPKGQTEQQQRIWNEALNQIDEILKRECIFCGPILIDMIDCDVEGDGKDSEFGLARNLAAEIKQTNEWDII